MDIHLSIVGFFHEIASIPVTVTVANPTIKDVLEAYKAAEAGKGISFQYTVVPSPFLPSRNLVFAFSYKGFLLDSVLSNMPYSQERVWQFYVVGADNKVVPTERTPFDVFPVSAGQTVIWRLVTVLKNPKSPKRVKQGKVAPETLVRDDAPTSN